jgi:hypothetical protein
MPAKRLVRRLASTNLRLVVAFCLCSAPQAKAGSSAWPARLDGVQSGTISLRQIRDVTTLAYVPKSGGATRRLKLSTPDGIFRGSFDRATFIGEIPGKVVLLSDTTDRGLTAVHFNVAAAKRAFFGSSRWTRR